MRTARQNGRRHGRKFMRLQGRLGIACVALAAFTAMASAPVRAQGVGKYFAPRDQVVAIRAGRLFDSRSGTILENQVVLIRGDRIADVGASVEVPAGAAVIDISAATVLPGMIETHVHVKNSREDISQRTLLSIVKTQI